MFVTSSNSAGHHPIEFRPTQRAPGSGFFMVGDAQLVGEGFMLLVSASNEITTLWHRSNSCSLSTFYDRVAPFRVA